MNSDDMEMQPDLDNADSDDHVAFDKENIPSAESEPQVPSLPSALITVEPPSPGIVSDNNSLMQQSENIEAEAEAGTAADLAASSTPTLTVRERVREYASKAGGVGDEPDGNSLSSSRSSIRAAFDKDDKEWILAASAADIFAMRRLLATAGGSTGGSAYSNACKRRVNYQFPFNGFAALHFAAKLNKPDCCRFLLENGANPDAKSYAGQTPLHLACYQECREVMEYLLKLPSRASLTPDYSGKLPHELIRNRESFADILSAQPRATNMEKRGSFLGDLPTSRSHRADDAASLHGGVAGGGSGGSSGSGAATSSSWLSGVRASFRGKAGSQTKLSLRPSAAGASGQQTGRVGSSPAAATLAAAAVLLTKSKRSQSQQQQQQHPLPPTGQLGGSILDKLSSADSLQHPHPHHHHHKLPWRAHSDSKKKQNRLSKKTL